MDFMKAASRSLALGLGLIVFGFAWPMLFGGRVSYTQEDAQEYQRASETLHNTLHQHGGDGHNHSAANGGPSPPANDATLTNAWDDYNQAVAKRDAQLNRGQTTGLIAKILGCLTAAVGLVMFFIARRAR